MTRLQKRKLNGRPAPRNKNRLVREHDRLIRQIITTLGEMLPIFHNLHLFSKVTAKHIDDIENRLNKKGI